MKAVSGGDSVRFGSKEQSDPPAGEAEKSENPDKKEPSSAEKIKAGFAQSMKRAFNVPGLIGDALIGALVFAISFPIFHVLSPAFIPLMMTGMAFRGFFGFLDGYKNPEGKEYMLVEVPKDAPKKD